MKRSGKRATIVASAVLCWSIAPAAQAQIAAPQDAAVATQEQPAAAQEQAIAPTQEAAATPAPEQAIAPVQDATVAPAQEQTVAAQQPVVASPEPAAAPPQESVATQQPVVAAQEQAATPPQEQAAAPPQEQAAAVPEESAEPEAEASEPAEEPVAEKIEEPKNARFLNINDALPTRFFDAAGTAPDPADPNRLVIALHTDNDRATWKANDFRASTAAFSHLAAIDTISFKIEAPKGHRIAKVIYTQRGIGSQIRLGRASGATHWVVGDYAAQIGLFGTNPSLVGVADFSERPQASVDVSITTGLFAFAAPTSGSASLEVTSADVQVELVPDGV